LATTVAPSARRRLNRQRTLKLRDELLNESLFLDLDHIRQLIDAWVADYNTASHTPRLGTKRPWPRSEHLIAPTGANSAETLVAVG
jgi:hypothetical protein